MRRSLVLRSLALGALAAVLWLGPGLVPGDTALPRPASPAPRSIDRPKTRPPTEFAPPPDGTVVALAYGPAAPIPAPSLAVALDELYFPQGPAATRHASIPAQTGLTALLAHAATFPAPGPRLVLYPVSGPRNATTRRILNPGLEVALATASAATPAPRPDLGIVAWERPAYAPDRAIARIVGDPAQPLRAAAALASSPGILSVRPLLARQWSRRFIPDDPLFKDQWHLRNTGQQGGIRGIDIRAVPAWDTATGAGIVIGIVDDGLDYAHPDLAPAYDARLGHDWNDHDADPYPAPGTGEIEGDDHATAVAGLAAARGGNSLGVSGAAPAATLASLRLISAPTDDTEDAEAMTWRNDVIRVKNNSWGPADTDGRLYPPGPFWRAAVIDAVTHGRDGLGTLFVWAAGNGQSDGDQGSKDGYASLRHVIPVGAVTNRGVPASFSEGGPHLVVAAPGDARVGLATTDRPGDLGYNTSTMGYPGDYYSQIDYTRAFVGTSASAPVVSGVVALLLEARPDLGWRDLKEIFLRASTPLQSTHRDWTTRPAGDSTHPIKHHPRLGGGLVNALDALALARTWIPLASELTLTTGPLHRESAIPDAGAPIAFTASVFHPTDDPATPDPRILRVEHVELTLDITHPFRGDLEIKLSSPAGVTSVFAVPTRSDSGDHYKDADGTAGYTFSSVRHWGEASAGAAGWRISVRDAFQRDVGTLHSATLTLHGTPLTIPAAVTEPAPQALATGSTLVLAAGFSGGNLTHQWTRDGKPIPGATAATYRLDNFTAKTAGAYACVARNLIGEAMTTPVAITLDDTARRTVSLLASQVVESVPDPSPGPVHWSATGLPKGLAIDPLTGALTGRSQAIGTHRVVIASLTPEGVRNLTPIQMVIDPLPGAVVGSYAGVVGYEQKAYTGAHGYLTVTLDANGVFSGAWTSLGRTLPIKGTVKIPTPATAWLEISLPPRTAGAGLVFAGKQITINLPFDGSPATGSPTEFMTETPPAFLPPPIDAPVVLRRLAFSAQNPTTEYEGPYTLTLADDFPYPLGRQVGHAPGTLVVLRDGRVKWRLHPLGETKAVTGSSVLTEGLQLPLHVTRPKSQGALLADGWLRLDPDEHSLTGDICLWTNRPALVVGGRYLRPTSESRLLATDDEAPGLAAALQSPNLFLGQTTALPLEITVTAQNKLRVVSSEPLRFSATFAPATGIVSGKFTLVDPDPLDPSRNVSRVIAYSAVTLSAENRIQGTFVLPPLDPSAESSASGSIEFYPLSANPAE